MHHIGFIGAGRMAQALARGIHQSQPELNFLISDPNELACNSFQETLGPGSVVEFADSNADVVEKCETVFIAVKPQFLEEALASIHEIQNRPLLISVVAGITIGQLNSLTDSNRVIRVMPNTPCLIGEGISAVCSNPSVDDADMQRVVSMMTSVGQVVRVPESQIDAVTGLSGSGPAFVFSFVESLIDAGVLAGLPREIARTLVLQTVLGSSRLLELTGEHPAILRDQVTSPGGTTISGLKELESGGFRDSLMSAVKAAYERSIELGNIQ